VIQFTPDDTEVGQRVDVVLARRADCTRTLAQRALRSGVVRVGGEEVRPSHRLEAGEVVEGEVPDPTVAPPVAEDIPIDVRYSDDRVMVVSKPAGLVTHPAHGHEGSTLVNGLLALGEPLAAASSTRPGIVHRLDKDTSGLLLVAKDDDARDFLVEALRRREVKRTYVALVRSPMPAPSGTIDAPLGRHPRRRWAMSVLPGGRAAVTHYRVLDDTGEVALLEVELETGRTHQIRVHLSHLGRPVLGDGTYGGRSELSVRLGLHRPFLHAIHLAWPHPSDGHRVEVRDELPGDLARVLMEAGLDAHSIEGGS
jgi:23S rRNA pseudouridine1911/1915/1917 synthase